jgi:integrase
MRVNLLLARLLYGTGLRITKALQLRFKDLDFGQHAVFVREGKGGKDRVFMLPASLAADLRAQLARGRLVWIQDVATGQAGVIYTHVMRMGGMAVRTPLDRLASQSRPDIHE